MRLAVEQAEKVKGATYPNPPVGAVILDATARSPASGATEPPGGAHAEIVALRRAGTKAQGGTAVVTLEPCNHHGRTPPCVDALLRAGVAAVVYAVADPNPMAAGGAARLAAAGVDVAAGVGADLVAGGPLREWLHKQRTGLPHRHLEVRHQHRRPQRRRRRLQPVDHQRGGARRRASAPRRGRRDHRRHRHGVRRRPDADRPAARRRAGRPPAAARRGRRARNILGVKGSQRRFAHHGDPHPRSARGDQGARRPHRRAARRRAHAGRGVPAGRRRSTGSWPTSRRSCWAVRSPRSTTSACPAWRRRCAGGSTVSTGSGPTCC